MSINENKLIQIFNRTDDLLWSAYKSSLDGVISPDCQLIFPKYTTNTNIRVSEQEAKIVFLQVLNEQSINYSIETPTQKNYNQKSKTNKFTSARSDISIYNKESNKLYNIEFKNSTFSEKSNFYSIRKDFEKLFCEPFKGVWFHTLESINNSTLKNQIYCYKKILNDIKNNKIQTCESNKIENNELLMHICILKHRFSITKRVSLNNVDKIDNFIYKVTREKLNDFDSNYWNLRTYK